MYTCSLRSLEKRHEGGETKENRDTENKETAKERQGRRGRELSQYVYRAMCVVCCHLITPDLLRGDDWVGLGMQMGLGSQVPERYHHHGVAAVWIILVMSDQAVDVHWSLLRSFA